MPSHPSVFYKIVDRSLWSEAERAGVFAGAGIDKKDGYIHFSTAEQAPQTAALHFAGVKGLVLVAVDATVLGPALKWEPSRNGMLFPHLYTPLPMNAVLWTRPLPLGQDGRHAFPPLD
jgi:uncharacterized protein (DUF952 family)